MHMKRTCSLLLLALSALFTQGCGSAEDDKGDLVPVTGKVTFKGQPLAKGVVKFDPVDDGKVAKGELQSDGSFSLSTFKPGDGAVVARHRVTVSGTAAVAAAKKGKELIPGKYTSRMTSGLEADVSRDNHKFTFDLN